MWEYPGGTTLVLQTTTASGAVLSAIGYKCNLYKVLTFLCTENAGSTLEGTKYKARYADDNRHIHVRNVDRPAVIASYFQNSNAVDQHNLSQSRW